jgi:hypothetical protein
MKVRRHVFLQENIKENTLCLVYIKGYVEQVQIQKDIRNLTLQELITAIGQLTESNGKELRNFILKSLIELGKAGILHII